MIGADDFRVTVPALPRLRFRHYAGAADLPGMVAVNVAVRRANGIDEVPTVEMLANQYANLTNCDPARDVAVVELDGAIVGYVRVGWSDASDGSRSYDSTCLLHPDHLGQGVGRAMLAWGEARIREIAADHPADRSRWFESETWNPEPPGTRLLTRSGYRPVRTFYEMIRPDLENIPHAEMPDGFEIRPVNLADIRAVREAQIDASRGNWDEVEDSDEAFARFVGDPRLDPALHIVAFVGDEVAGAVLNVVENRDVDTAGGDADAAATREPEPRGTLEAVFVRPPYRRRGLARALIVRSLALLKERGMTSANLGVDAENPHAALHLYTSCGFEVGGSSTVWRKPLDLTESER